MIHDADTTPPPTGRARYLGWVVALVLVGVAWAGAVALRAGTDPVPLDGWQPGLDAGTAQAEAQGRPMLVMFTADWCGPCQTLKKDVIQTPAVRAAIDAGFVPVVVDLTDQSSNNPGMAAAQRYGVSGIPMLILTDAQGQPLPGTIAYPDFAHSPPRFSQSPEGFLAWLASAEPVEDE
jgi:thiol:disulfide interchange protein DsbD